uniref:DNA topoisomerase (ATP-hydrolyzing) n=1 Tax=viral metagenome TaxID=1070528 RepID=A0A6C0IKY0_9ZZZZ
MIQICNIIFTLLFKYIFTSLTNMPSKKSSTTTSISNTQENDELSTKYQQKTDKQHILDNPDTYIGSIEQIDSDLWILDEGTGKIFQKEINYIPGLFKLFDEGIVNCRDHVIRMKQFIDNGQANCIPVTNIDITIEDDGTIVMLNDGNGIDVAQHPEYNIWIPELIFGHLRTSTNYNKDEKKIVGGKNGFGFKLVLIWSSEGSIETIDHIRGLKYTQEFKSNLDEICPPKITKCKSKPYTKISFKPDYARFGLSGLSPDFVALLKKRIYDVAAITDKNVKVKCNSSLISIKTFPQYVDMYIGDKSTTTRIHESFSDRWEYIVCLTPTNEFCQMSFVNGIHTSKGGKHVEYILNQITRKLVDYIEKKRKVRVNVNSIKEQLMLFIRCDIENPAFDSQTKDYMNTPVSKFGSKCEVSDKFIEKIAKLGVMDAACALTEIKETKAAKKTDGNKSKSIRGIPKLTDANWAGTAKSCDCTLICCEGDSAKAGILSGLSSDDRNVIGVYPMKGKILNVRGETTKKIVENKEISELKKIMGLEKGKKYADLNAIHSNLRYSKVLFMTDQDLDGSHIKGLGINLFQHEWPSLVEIPGFIGFMNTPILKAKKGNSELNFYNDGEYTQWKEENDSNGWKIKYYKGLGTSTGKEFREYFEHKKIVGFEYNETDSDDKIDLVFNKKRSDDRKDWLEKYDRQSYMDTNKPLVSYEEFIDREFIHFSKYDCDRSIPNLMDGLKISLRKILYSAFKKRLTSEIKVAQFSGYVSEHSGYHHGEASLNSAIVGLAQNFVGSNNINLFLPNGQFGTRLQGGKDSASERYIFTLLNSITRHIYPEADDNILTYLDDDGTLVEPIFYAPIIPMIIVNGSKGIGTGFSTDVMCYNVNQIIDCLRSKLLFQEFDAPFVPYYEGFTGTITPISEVKFLIKGVYEKLTGDKIRVSELPIGHWTESFKEHLENLMDTKSDNKKKSSATVKDYDDLSKDTNVEFVITFHKNVIADLESNVDENGCNGLEKLLKLYTTNTNSNMHLFDANDKLKKYNNVREIIDDYFKTRLDLYDTRKTYLINAIKKELILLSNKARYINENLEGTIDLRRKKKDEVNQMLTDKQYDIIDGDNDFKYLVKMAMDSVTEENVEKINKEHENKLQVLEKIQATTVNQMWLQELNDLETEYAKYKEQRNKLMQGDYKETPKKTKTKTKIIKNKLVINK